MQNFSLHTHISSGRCPNQSACLRGGYELVKDQYWLFVGMALVAIIVGSVVPFRHPDGSDDVRSYLANVSEASRRERGIWNSVQGLRLPPGESIIATLIHVVPVVVILVPFYIVFYGALLFWLPRNGEPDPGELITFFAVFFIFLILVAVLVMVISALFTFSYPLIVDRHMKGVDAVKLSVRAALANFFPLLGLLLLTGVLGFCGALLCYVGIFLVFPVTFAAMSIAYKQVFGISDGVRTVPGPPPPPTFT